MKEDFEKEILYKHSFDFVKSNHLERKQQKFTHFRQYKCIWWSFKSTVSILGNFTYFKAKMVIFKTIWELVYFDL